MSAPQFGGTAEAIGADVQREMTGLSWRDEPECPPFDDLRLLRLSYWGFDDRVHDGELVVAASVVDDVLTAFESIFAARFPLGAMKRIDAFGADDHASMAANNCSAFNYRLIETSVGSGTPRLSQHSFGMAIDINPVQNPWVRDDAVLPPAGTEYLDRDDIRPGMIVRPGPVVAAFESVGWQWGGEWKAYQDYHHFSASGG